MSATTAPQTLLALLRLTEDYFRTKGLASPRVDAEVLLAHVLGFKRFELYMNHDRPLTAEELDRYRELVRKRAGAVPLQHLTGEQAFRDLTLQVSDKVLIPRPETEELVERIFQVVAPEGSERPLRVCELGVGSGAISIALARAWPRARVWATDLSWDALEVARGNVACHELDGRVCLLHGNLFDPLDPQGEPFDLIVSNPPYIPTGELAGLDADVRDHEPHLALDGGEDGLLLIRAILEQAVNHLRPGGWWFLEIGHTQGRAVLELAEQQPHWESVSLAADIAGRDRIVWGRRKDAPAQADSPS